MVVTKPLKKSYAHLTKIILSNTPRNILRVHILQRLGKAVGLPASLHSKPLQTEESPSKSLQMPASLYLDIRANSNGCFHLLLSVDACAVFFLLT